MTQPNTNCIFISVYRLTWSAQLVSTPVTLPRLRTSDEHSYQAPQDGSPLNVPHLPDYPWLEEVRSKIWKKKEELEQYLFREVEVTQAHFTQLEERLNGQIPDRHEPEYDGKENDVRSVKLDVLISPRYLDNNELEVNDEDAFEMDVDSPEASDEDGPLFPFTLKFLDLTTLGLKNMPPCMPSPLFVRREYDTISTMIEHVPQYKNYTVVVSGQPGTGEVLVCLSRRI